MKTNLMKEFALATIDKVQEMNEKAEKARLHLSVDVDLATLSHSVSLYELDDQDRLKTPSLFFRHGSYLDLKCVKSFSKDLEDAEEYIDGYKDQNEAALVERRDDLKRQLNAVNMHLRKVRKAANK